MKNILKSERDSGIYLWGPKKSTLKKKAQVSFPKVVSFFFFVNIKWIETF